MTSDHGLGPDPRAVVVDLTDADELTDAEAARLPEAIALLRRVLGIDTDDPS